MSETAQRFAILYLLKTRAFWASLVALTVWGALLAYPRLTGVLGFEYALLYGVICTLVTAHFSLAATRHRARLEHGPPLVGTAVRIWAAAWLLQLPSLALICLNALRIPNCNFSEGFGLYLLMPGVGICFGCALGMALATLKSQRWATALVYLLPIASILWAVYLGLIHPPIFAYGHFFGFFPGSIYDEVREITRSLVLFRISTLALSAALLGFVAAFAGRDGWGAEQYRWRDALVRRDRQQLDGRFVFAQDRDAAAGALLWTFGFLLLLGALHWHRYELGTQHTNSSIQRALGGRLETPHFILYYDRNSMPPKTLQQMARDHEYRYHQLVRFFGHRPKRKIESYLFRDVAQKASLMGAARTMIARPWAYQYYLHGYQFPHNVLKHEMAHVFSAQFGIGPLRISARYGLLFNTALIEGVAVAADWDRSLLTPHEWSRAMLAHKGAPTPAQILDPAGFFGAASWTAYTIAGSFSRFLIQKYGMLRYKKVYGRAEFQKVYGKSLQTLSDEWRRYLLAKIELGSQAKRLVAWRFRRHRSIFVRICPHEIASLNQQVSQLARAGSYPRAIETQKRICQLSPQSHHKLRLLRLLVASKQDRQARALVADLLRQNPAKEAPLVHSQLRSIAGQLAYRRKQPAKALEHYRAALRDRVYLSSRRSLRVYIYALTHPKVTDVIMRYLADSGNVGRLLQLQQRFSATPQEPMLAYLLARRYYFSDRHRWALRYLRIAAPRLRSFPLRVEILRMRARAHFALGAYSRAAQLFAQLSSLPLPRGAKNKFLDWRARALWEQKVYGKPVPALRK